MSNISIGNRTIGRNSPCFIIAEIGINHNGDIETAKKLIKVASFAGCDAVKFQKRTIDIVYTREELDQPRESVFGKTNRDLKKGLEFGEREYRIIDQFCKEVGIMWFASCWDEQSADFIEQFNPPCYKIASASLTDDALLRHHRKYGKPILLSTGMSTMEQIDHAVEVLGKDDLILLHTVSTYPANYKELNLNCIKTLKEKYRVPVGYSGHEFELCTTLASLLLGASVIERHITIDRTMWGSDQAASVEPIGLQILVQNIRHIESALGDGQKRVLQSEIPIIKKLRRI